jgi:hypothetical protein
MKLKTAAPFAILAFASIGHADIDIYAPNSFSSGVTVENFEGSQFTPPQLSNVQATGLKANALAEPVTIFGGLATVQSGDGSSAEPYNSGVVVGYTSNTTGGGLNVYMGSKPTAVAPTHSGSQGLLISNTTAAAPYTATITFNQVEDFFGGYFQTVGFASGDPSTVSFEFFDANGKPISTVYPYDSSKITETLTPDATGATMTGIGFLLTQRDPAYFKSVEITGYDVTMDDLVVGNVTRPVPEPATCTILGAGVLALIRSRRKKA